MKKIVTIILAGVALLFSGVDASAQMSLEQTPNNVRPLDLEMKPGEQLLNPQIEKGTYTTDAILAAERRRVRKERNTFEVKFDLKANQIFFDNWAKGGDNNFNGSGVLFLRHRYNRERLTYSTTFDARYGMNVIDSTVFKTEDKFTFNFTTDWKIRENWSFSGIVNLQSQFAKGYKSRTDQQWVSSFMSPGTLDLSVGITYNPQYWKITLAPVTGSMYFVLNDSLSRKGIGKVDVGKHFKPMVGPSLRVDFQKKFAKDFIEYRTQFYTFYNFTLSPMARWENWLDFYITKWMKTSFYWYLISDRHETKLPKLAEGNYLQMNYSLGLAFTFNYKNK
jgi:hypothetical protein